jgi:hypothetical protein
MELTVKTPVDSVKALCAPKLTFNVGLEEKMNDQSQNEFVPAKWVLILSTAFTLMTLSLPLISLIQSKPSDLTIFLSIVMLPLCLMGILGIVSYYKTRIIFRDEDVVYRGIYFDPIFHIPKISRWTGLISEKAISLQNLKSVSTNSHYIILDTEDQLKQLLPHFMMFNNYRDLLSQLYDAQQNKKEVQPGIGAYGENAG